MARQFLWGSTEGDMKVHLANWDLVTREKDKGGLGIKRMHHMKLAFMAKMGWRLVTEIESL